MVEKDLNVSLLCQLSEDWSLMLGSTNKKNFILVPIFVINDNYWLALFFANLISMIR